MATILIKELSLKSLISWTASCFLTQTQTFSSEIHFICGVTGEKKIHRHTWLLFFSGQENCSMKKETHMEYPFNEMKQCRFRYSCLWYYPRYNLTHHLFLFYIWPNQQLWQTCFTIINRDHVISWLDIPHYKTVYYFVDNRWNKEGVDGGPQFLPKFRNCKYTVKKILLN